MNTATHHPLAQSLLDIAHGMNATANQATLRAAAELIDRLKIEALATWHTDRASNLRAALVDIAETKSLTATPAQLVAHIQRVATRALTDDAMAEPVGPVSDMRKALKDLHDDIQERIDDGARFNPGTLSALKNARLALDA